MSKLPDQAFRDTIGTIDEEGNRKFIFPKKPAHINKTPTFAPSLIQKIVSPLY